MPRNSAEVDGIMLAWARSLLKMSVEVAASKIRVPAERLRAWEAGEAKPTVRQLRKIAKVYGQSFATFYLPGPPTDFNPDVHDYRRPPGAVTDVEPAILLDLRTSNERRLSAVELAEALGEPYQEFGLSTTIDANPEFVGRSIRVALGIEDTEQASWEDARTAFQKWREAVESLGVLVFQSAKLPFPKVRGYSIDARFAPAIVLNRKDVPEGRSFTLLHELTHVMLQAGGICDLRTELSLPPEEQQVEVFCNAVAGAALIPRDLLTEEIRPYTPGERVWSDLELRTLARRFGVSREVVLRRLLLLGRTTKAAYQAFREAEEQSRRQRRKKGKVRIAPARDALSQLGRPYVGAVLGAHARGAITSADATAYLGLRLKHFAKLADLASA